MADGSGKLGSIVKVIGLVITVLLALDNVVSRAVGDRFRVENRLARMETTLEDVKTAVQMIADQDKRIAVVESRLGNVERRIDHLEVKP